MKKTLTWFLSGLFFAFCGLAMPVDARLTIDITKGVVRTIPLAFPGFEGHPIAEDMVKVIRKDLQNSGVFEVLGAKGLQTPGEAFAQPSLMEWKSCGEGAVLLSGLLDMNGPELMATFRLYDVHTHRLIGEAQVKGTPSGWRLLAHRIANAVYQRLTGEPGYFDTQIIYTAQYGPATNKIRRIAIIDQDGENCRFLTTPEVMSLMPRCSPRSPQITFCALGRRSMKLHLMDLARQREETLPAPGIGISPRFSPDGTRLIFCLARDGTTSIYQCDLRDPSRRLTRLTQTSGRIDVSPSFSPDGHSLVFSSDRAGGAPKLYIMRSDGSGSPRCLSQGPGKYLSPIWSPDGRWIAFVKSHQGSYYLGVIAPDGSQERLIASDHVIDYPSWAPNSRLLIFAAQSRYFGPFSLHIVDLTGHSLRRLETKHQGVAHEGNHPDWSPHPYTLGQ